MESASNMTREDRKRAQVETDLDNFENAMMTFQAMENMRCAAVENARILSTREIELQRFAQLTATADRAKAKMRAAMTLAEECEVEDEPLYVKQLQYYSKIAISKQAKADAAEARCAQYLA